MSFFTRVLARLRGAGEGSESLNLNGTPAAQVEALIQAHGDWLALLATILERERVITGADLASSLAEFAALTAEDRPAEGRILSFWASRLQDTAASLRDFPSLH